MAISTRQNNHGKWWCNGTIQGYDVSFEADTIPQARRKMVDYLLSKKINPDAVTWEPAKYYYEPIKSQCN